MIPQRAMFYWAGNPMSWLRSLTINSFMLFNPGWEVELLNEEYQNDKRLSWGQNSDIARWRWLHDTGGVALATDMVFLGPLPAFDDVSGAILMNGSKAGSLALVASEAGSCFTSDLCSLSADVVDDKPDYQAFGIDLLNRYLGSFSSLLAFESSRRVSLLDYEMFHPVKCYEVEKLWECGDINTDDVVAVHWYGAHPTTTSMEMYFDSRLAKTSNRAIAKVIRDAGLV